MSWKLHTRAFPDLLDEIGLRPTENYGALDLALYEVALPISDPRVVLLFPHLQFAYFEHVFFARGASRWSRDGTFWSTTASYAHHGRSIPVDVIYRRIEDDLSRSRGLSREHVGRGGADAGIPGRKPWRSPRSGPVSPTTRRSAPGPESSVTPRQEPIPQNVETISAASQKRALPSTISELVVKPVGEAGGYGSRLAKASRPELEECRAKLIADPANYISQPCIKLSVAPTLVDGHVEPRHVDLRPFAVTGSSTWVLPGGLTRVALRRGSLVVNSSQGGGSKDTWVVA
jgi:uncharacterized circularly permuted ATP-grasp superfamily protein